MKKRASFFRKGITTKLLAVNLLICIAFGLVTAVVFFSFSHIKSELKKIFAEEVIRIVGNARTGRELARVLADTNLLVSTFYGKEEFLKTGGESLIRKTDAVIQGSSDERLKESLKMFMHNVRQVLEQCAEVNRIRGETEETDRKLDNTLTALREHITGKIFDLTLEGMDASGMKQISVLVPGYLETLLRINVRFNRLGPEYFELPPEEKEHPIFTLLDDLDSRLRTLTASDPEIAEYGRQLLDDVGKYKESVFRFHDAAAELRLRLERTEHEKENLLTLMSETDSSIAKTTENAASALTKLISGSATGSLMIFLATLPTLIFAFFISQSVRTSLSHVILGLRKAFERVADASGHVNSASQQLSADTSEQAASLEETSASLEEIASMTRLNADNAGRVNLIMKTSARDIETASLIVSRLTCFIKEISESGEQIRRIIQTIDEIAFQTHLLSMNAGVEAVRAGGRAGAGFAVVAAEVRKLALQSADSARSTADIIENTVTMMHDGSKLVSSLGSAFGRVEDGSRKVGELIGEIAAASDEQSRGIDYLNNAVADMDKVVQRNAAHAEELAATSGEMNAQAGYVSRFVRELSALVGANGVVAERSKFLSLFSNIKGDAAGAFSAAVTTLPLAVGYGILVFSPLGQHYAPQGAAAGIYSAVLCGFFAALFGANEIQITGPRAMLMLVLMSVVTDLADSPYLVPISADSRYGLVAGLVAVCVFIGGIFQVILGVLRFGNVIKYVPHPVVAGFTNGIAVLLIVRQINPFSGADISTGVIGSLSGRIQPLTLAVGLTTLTAFFLSKRFIRTVPATLTGLAAGTVLHYIFAAYFSHSSLGPAVGNLCFQLPRPDIFLNLFYSEYFSHIQMFLPDLLIPGLVLGLLGSTETLLNAVTCGNLTGKQYDSHRELVGQGIGNIIAAFFGALPAAGSVARTLANFRAGARTSLSGMLCSIFIFLMMILLGPLIGKIPLSVIAGILISVGIGLFDSWTVGFIRKGKNPFKQHQAIMLSFFAALAVTAVTVGLSPTAAAGVGVLAASLLFAWKRGKTVIRRGYFGTQFHSKKMRTSEQIEILEKEGNRIAVFELQGPVFFNSAENAVLHIESFIKKADYFILDMKRVSAVDITGATLILQFGARLEKEKKYLLISYLKENLSLWEFFEIMDMKKLSDNTVFFQDTDGAAEWAEEHLLSVLSRSAAVCAQIRPEDMDIVKNFTQRELADFQEKLRCRTYRKGEAVFREGDPGKDLFLLTKGSVTVKVRLPESDRFRRLFTFTPGVVFGEVALLDGKPRSADVWAEEETEVFRLSLEDFDVLRKEKPEIVIKLLLNIAKEFSRNLRRISDEVRAMENG